MNRGWWLQGWLVAGVLPLLVLAAPAGAESIGNNRQSSLENDHLLTSQEHPTNEPPTQLSDLDHPATTVDEWVQQIAQSLVQVTGVQVNPTETGVEVILETAERQLAAPATSVVGNALIADIPNAVLALPEGEFQAASPTEGIALVSVTPTGNGIRVAITGTEAPPIAEVRTQAQGLVLSVAPGIETADAVDDDVIQVVVTGTRTEEEETRIPRSITVIDREELETQRNLPVTLREILGREIPGFNPPSLSRNDRGTIRGRGVSYLIDGVPVESTFGRQLQTIAPEAIERIEVVRGSNAVYGSEATGGTINIITRRPADEPFVVTLEAGANAYIGDRGEFFTNDSIGNRQSAIFSGDLGVADYILALSRERSAAFFDAEGDRIFLARPIDENESYGVLGTIGVDIDSNQRLQFTVNYYDSERVENEIIADPESEDKARAIKVGRQEFIDTDPYFDRNLLLNLTYTHANLLGNSLQAQAYFRDYSALTAGVQDRRDDELGVVINNSRLDEQNWGGRIQIESPLWQGSNALWGIDYDNRRSDDTTDILDPVAFDESNGRTLRKIGELFSAPSYDLEELGIFAQLQWDITDNFQLSGGARYANFRVNAPDYISRFGDPVGGGTINFDDVIFNVGVLYEVTNNIGIFANFSQGFSPPNFAELFSDPPENFSLEEDFEELQPVKVNNYEIGIRGQWSDFRASIAGFFTESDLGEFIVGFGGTGEVTIARAPQRTYGIEAAFDWQPSNHWRLGSAVSWQEGEADFEDSGNFVPLFSGDVGISPLKATVYVEHQTTPGWRNRLQVLAVGDRNRAFEEGIDVIPIEGYIVVDLISQIEAFGGTISIGIENLFNNQYLDLESQTLLGFDPTRAPAARGRTLSLIYRTTF
jgi:iron complex outermembrane receptor protein